MRCVLCERAQDVARARWIDKYSVARALDVEETQARRFIKHMVEAGMMCLVHEPPRISALGACYGYRLTLRWHVAAAWLRSAGLLPGTCEAAGCDRQAVQHPFRGHYYCRHHMMHRDCEGCARRGTPACARMRVNGERPGGDRAMAGMPLAADHGAGDDG